MKKYILSLWMLLAAIVPAHGAGSSVSPGMAVRQDYAGAVSRSAQAKLRESISVMDFGAKLDGVSDDTAALVAAAAAGVDLMIPNGNLKLTGPVVFSAGQSVKGVGTGGAKITAVCNCDALTWTGGGQGGGISDVTIEAGGMTGGRVIVNDTENRATYKNLTILNPFNGIFIKKTNVARLRDLWINAVRGAYAIQVFGDGSNRTDVVDIDNIQVSGAGAATSSSAVGLIVDGNVNTVDLRHFAAVNMLRGLHVKNTSGGANPAFLTGYDVQIDYPYAESIRLDGAARSVMLSDFYAHGSATADGVYIDSSVQNVSLSGGQVDSHSLRGIFAGGRYIKISGVNVSTNSKIGTGLYPGVEIGAASIGVALYGNLIGQWVGYSAETQSYGVSVAAGAKDYSVVGNTLRNNISGDYIDAAADATSVIIGNSQGSGTGSKLAGPLMASGGDLLLYGEGANSAKLGNASGGVAFAAQPATSSVNYMKAFGTAGTSAPSFEAVGSATNLDFRVAAKGNGVLQIGTSGMFAANGTVGTAMTAVGPTGSRATVQKWLVIKDQSGNPFYIPCY